VAIARAERVGRLDSARWQDLKRILERAIDLPEAERARLFDESCGSDAELRAEIESLLLHHTVSSPLDQPVEVHAIPLLYDPPPETLGAYRIVSHIGLGGSSDVYLAERADGIFEKKTAVKILRAGIYGDDMRRRFQRERQILADLDHPNIVKLLDGGITADGRPYLIEEIVEGPPVTIFAESKQFTLTQRLALFLSICEAVAYAHRRGVVHRDLKPSNILTSAEGVPKLVDFGVAGLLATAGEGPQATISQYRYWTPAYSSPEHIRGEPVGPASDVYSLGLVLCELLLGRPAADVTAAVDALPRQLRATVARCLEPKAVDRYADAGALLDAMRGVKGSGRRLPRWSWPQLRDQMRVVAYVVMLIAAACVVWLHLKRDVKAPSSSSFLLTSEPGIEAEVSLSPDGEYAVYVARESDGRGTKNLYVKRVDGGEARRLTHQSDHDRWPRWSPDGATIAFARAGRNGVEIYTMPPAGGREERIIRLSHPGSPEADAVNWVTWTADSKGLILVDRPSPSGPFALYLMPLATGDRRQLTHPLDESGGDRNAAVSPDGGSVAFLRWQTGTESDLFVMPLRGGTPTRLTFDNLPIRGLAWTPGGTEIVFSSMRKSAVNTLWRVPANGAELPSRIGGAIEGSVWPSVAKSPVGSGFRIAYQAFALTINLMRWDASRGPESQPTAVCPSTRMDWHAQISPDGRRVAFSSTRNGSSNIWICEGGGRERQVTNIAGASTDSPRWSPDGRSLVFTSHGKESRDVFLADIESGQIRTLISEASDDGRASFSRDGRWIYFRSARSGRNEIWKKPAGGGVARQITRSGAMEGFESQDGKLVYFVKDRPQLGVWSIPAEGGDEVHLADGVRDTRWAVARDGIYFVTVKAPFDIMRYRFDTRRTELVYRLPGNPSIWAGFTASLDGASFVWPQTIRESSDIAILDGVR